MCTYTTVGVDVDGSAKGPASSWFRVRRATVYYDHPVHALVGHSLNIDLADPAAGAGARVGLELTAASARELVRAITEALDSVPEELLATEDRTAVELYGSQPR